jgi:Globin
MQVQAHIVALGVKAFEALFSQDPYLLKLFPFKDEHGVPIMHELEVHALKVFSTFGTVVEGLDNMTTTGQALDALVKCACSSPFLHLLTDAGTVQCVEDLSTACSVCCMQLGHVQADHLCLRAYRWAARVRASLVSHLSDICLHLPVVSHWSDICLDLGACPVKCCWPSQTHPC